MKTVVITINYNNVDDTEECIQSIFETSSKPLVVVVDNASTRGDVNAVCGKYDNVVLIRNEANIGFGRGNNVGIRWALENTDCRYILLINNDATVGKETISLLENYMDANSGVDVCSPRIVFAEDHDRLWYGGGELNWMDGVARAWNTQRSDPVDVTFVTGCAMMLRREVLMSAGGFDPRYFMYAEDIEFCARLVGSGKRLVYVPAPVVYHKVHGSLKEKGDSFEDYFSTQNRHLAFFLENVVCNFMLVLDTHARGAERLLSMAHLFARSWYWGLKYLLKGRFDAFHAIAKSHYRFVRIRGLPFINELAFTGRGASDIVKIRREI